MENGSVQAGEVRPHDGAEMGAAVARRSGRPHGKRYGASAGRTGEWSTLRRARIDRGLTLEEVAAISGTSTRMVMYAETKGYASNDPRSVKACDRILNAILSQPVKKPKTAGEAIHRARLRARLRIVDFAAELGVAFESVSRWESGKHSPPPRQRQRLFTVFGLDLRAFFPLDDYEGEAGDPGPRETSTRSRGGEVRA